MSHQLTPGNYFIEMAFRRPVSEETLASALSGMGFVNIEFDKNEDVVVGAALGRVSMTSAVSRAGSPSFRAVKAAAAAPVAAPKAAPKAAVRVPMNASETIRHVSAQTLRSMDPVASAAKAPSFAAARAANVKAAVATAKASSVATTKVNSLRASNAIAKTSAAARFQEGGQSGPASPGERPGVSNQGSESPAENRSTEAESAVYEETSETSSNNYADRSHQSESDYSVESAQSSEPEAEHYERQEPVQDQPEEREPVNAPVPERALLQKLSADMSKAMTVSVPDRWKRWVEWGSPFATSPTHLVNISGEEEANITRFRFVATLTRSFTPTNRADTSWVFIRRLSINPFADLSFQLVPFKLNRGGFYEFRFFSRIKSNPTKESVKETMAAMGFSPMKLNLLKKNMRIPRRGNVSVCMWLGIGRWTAPNSITTTEDPFFFESVKMVNP